MSEQRDKIARENILKIIESSNAPEASLRALAFLFPKVSKQLNTWSDTVSKMPGERNLTRRISVRQYSDQYFTLSTERQTWSRPDVGRLLESNDPESALLEALNRISAHALEDQISLRLELLDIIESAVPNKISRPIEWFIAVLIASPFFILPKDVEERGLYLVDNTDRIRVILTKIWGDFDGDERSIAFKRALDNLVDFSMICDFSRSTLGDSNPLGSKKENSSSYPELRQLLLNKVRELAWSGKVWGQADVSSILWFWWGTDYGDEVLNFTSLAMNSPEHAAKLMKASISTVFSTNGNYEHVDKKSWANIFDVDKLKEIAEKMVTEEDAIHLAMARRFLHALENWKERR